MNQDCVKSALHAFNIMMHVFVPQCSVRMGLHVGVKVISACEVLEADRTGQDFLLSFDQTLLICPTILQDLQHKGHCQLFVA